jgi:hypothetical protein
VVTSNVSLYLRTSVLTRPASDRHQYLRLALLTATLVCVSCVARPPAVSLDLAERTTLHVGDLAQLPVLQRGECGSSCHRATGGYSAGGAAPNLGLLSRVREGDHDLYLYRAESPGDAVFVLSPNGLPDKHCLSCATLHYFVTVIP